MITLYPAIDIHEGKAVRLIQGDFAQSTIFNEDPVEQATQFFAAGAQALHVVDLTGAREGAPAHAPLVAAIAAIARGPVQLGGGLRSRAAIETALATGVQRLVVGTAVVEDGDLLRWAVTRLGDRLVVALDAKEGKIATHGWTKVTDVDAKQTAVDLAKVGVRHILYTDIGRDGMLGGPNLSALRRVAVAASGVEIIASGGVSSLDDLRALRDLKLPNLSGVIVGRALYEGRFTIPDAIATLASPKRR